MPAPFAVRPSGVHASSVTSSPFYSPMYGAASYVEEKDNSDDSSSKQHKSERQQRSHQWRPQLSPLMLASVPAAQPALSADEVSGGEWSLSPIQTSAAAHSISHRPSVPMSPLALPLSTSPLPLPRSQSLPPSSSFASSPRLAPAATPSVSSPFASLQPSPSFHPSPYHLSPATRPLHATHQFDTPPSRPSASPRLSAMHHSSSSSSQPTNSHSRGSLSDVCPSPLLSPMSSAPLQSQYDASMPQLSLDQPTGNTDKHSGRRVRPTTMAEDSDDAMYGASTARHQQSYPLPSRPTRQSPLRSFVGSSLSSSSSSSSSWWLASLSALRSSRLLLFVAVVTGVVLFQLVCAMWLLPSSSTGLPTFQRSASIAQLERSRQSAQSFQQSHADHLHTQHRDDEALRQAVADLQEHVRSHNNNRHKEERAAHTFEQDDSVVKGGLEPDSEQQQQPAEMQQAAFEPIDADTWK